MKLLDAELAKIGDSDVQEVLRRSLKAGGVVSGTGAVSKANALALKGVAAPAELTKAEQVRAVIGQCTGPFRTADLQAACPGVKFSYLRKLLTEFKKDGVIHSQGRGPSAVWVKGAFH